MERKTIIAEPADINPQKNNWVYTHILSPETRFKGITVVYAVFTVIMLLQRIIVTIVDLPPALIIPNRCCYFAFGILGIVLGCLWKDKTFWILFVLLLLKLGRMYFFYPYNEIQDVFDRILNMGFYAFFGCYSVGFVFTGKTLKRVLQAFLWLWTIAMVAYSVIGIYVVWTGEPVNILNTLRFYIDPTLKRLKPVFLAVEAGVLAAVSFPLPLILIASLKNKSLKIVCILFALIINLCAVLTVTKTAYIVIGIELAFSVCILLYDKLGLSRDKKQTKKPVLFGKWFAVIGAFLIITVGYSAIQMQAIDWFYSVRDGQIAVISNAKAENENQNAKTENRIVKRDIIDTSGGLETLFNGRVSLWEDVFTVLKEDTSALLFGESIAHSMDRVNENRSRDGNIKMYHTHNAYIQTLLENGIPALLLFLAFTVFFAINSFRLFKAVHLPLWQRLIPIPAIGCFLADLSDCSCYINNTLPQMTLLYLFSGLTIALGQYEKGKLKSAI